MTFKNQKIESKLEKRGYEYKEARKTNGANCRARTERDLEKEERVKTRANVS